MKFRLIIRLLAFVLTINFSAQLILEVAHSQHTYVQFEIDADGEEEENKTKEKEKLKYKNFHSSLSHHHHEFMRGLYLDQHWSTPTIELNSPPPEFS